MQKLKRTDLVLPELSYEIVGACFDAFTDVGMGQPEKVYQRAVAIHLRKRSLSFGKEIRYPVFASGIRVGTSIFDFLVENQVVLELKINQRFYRPDFLQTVRYISQQQLPLAILARFSQEGVRFTRILPPIPFVSS